MTASRKHYVLGSALALSLGLGFAAVNASDHDDGENPDKARALNLTDNYAFREDLENSATGSAAHMIFVQSSNPRSLPGQEYFFDSTARYEMHFTRAGTDNNTRPTGKEDIRLRFTFSAPDATTKVQTITIKAMNDDMEADVATTTAGGAIKTTAPAASFAGTPENNTVKIGDHEFQVFAGLRQDTFFFDVIRFFQTRATGTVAFAGTGDDFTAGYNVNSIVVRVPIAYLQNGSTATVFDYWSTISIPD